MDTSVMPTKEELTVIGELARTLLPTGMFPRALDTAGKIAAVLLRGRELGMGPMASLASIHVIEGRASLSAEGMMALVRRAGFKIVFLETTDRICRVRGVRGDQTEELAYTWADAEQFQKKEDGRWVPATQTRNYRSHPAAMLRARAVSAICRMLFSDLILGLVTPDEAEEIHATEELERPREAVVRVVESAPAETLIEMPAQYVQPAPTPAVVAAPVTAEAEGVTTRVLICQTQATPEPEMPTADQLGERPAEDDQDPPAPQPKATADAETITTKVLICQPPPAAQAAPPPPDLAAQRARFRELRALLGAEEVLAIYRRAGIGDGSKPTDAQRETILASMDEIAALGGVA